MTKFLIFPISTELDSLVAVMECDAELLELIRKRMALSTKIQELDSELAWLEFYHGVDLYERNDTLEAWLAEHADVDDLDVHHWVLADNEPDLGDASPQRKTTSYMVVDDRSCFWNINLKYSDVTCETAAVFDRDLGKWEAALSG